MIPKPDSRSHSLSTAIKEATEAPVAAPRAHEISSVLDSVKEVLVEKNVRYGDSALSPIGVFFTEARITAEPAVIGLCVRADDKLSRIRNSKELRKNDVFDLLGYIVLLCIKKSWTNFKEFLD